MQDRTTTDAAKSTGACVRGGVIVGFYGIIIAIMYSAHQ